MIGFLAGRVLALSTTEAVVEVNGVGYVVACNGSLLSGLAPGAEVRLWTHLSVKEDALNLFGFSVEAELKMFEALLTVGGVGPKAALGICGVLTPEGFRRALVSEDVDALTAAPGIGRKTAQRIILDLKEKLARPDLALLGDPGDALARARSALQNLGYSPAEVRAALSDVGSEDERPVEEVVRSALQVLAG